MKKKILLYSGIGIAATTIVGGVIATAVLFTLPKKNTSQNSENNTNNGTGSNNGTDPGTGGTDPGTGGTDPGTGGTDPGTGGTDPGTGGTDPGTGGTDPGTGGTDPGTGGTDPGTGGTDPGTGGTDPGGTGTNLELPQYQNTEESTAKQKITKVGKLARLQLIEVGSNDPLVQGDMKFALHWKPANALATSPTTWERVIDKMVRRLPYGPEIGMIRSISFDNNPSSLLGSTGAYNIQINVNAYLMLMINTNFLKGTAQNYSVNPQITYDIFAETLAESVFQDLFHEYGHAMTNIYLKQDNPRDGIDPIKLTQHNYFNGQTDIPSTISFNAEFVNQFKTILEYNSTFKTTGTPFTNNYSMPVSNLYSLKDLFDRANTRYVGSGGTTELDDVYRAFAADPSRYKFNNKIVDPLRELDQTYELPYYWGMSEAYTRKMMQATMALDTLGGNWGYKPDGWLYYLDSSNRVQKERSQMLFDATLSTNAFDSLDPNTPPETPFYNDYLFTKKMSGSTYVVDNSKAAGIYNAMTKTMGYQTGADIATVWYDIYPQGYPSSSTTGVALIGDGARFGGFISNSLRNKTFVGYWNNGVFVSVPIALGGFNFKVKSAINSPVATSLDSQKDNDYYFTTTPVSMGKWNGKQLFFADDATGANAVKLTTNNPLAGTTFGATNNFIYGISTMSTEGNGVALRYSYGTQSSSGQEYIFTDMPIL